MALNLNDPTPVRLRSEDQADDATALSIELAAQHRMLIQDINSIYSLVFHEDTSDEMAVRRLRANVLDAREIASRADQTRERFVRAVRASGRL